MMVPGAELLAACRGDKWPRAASSTAIASRLRPRAGAGARRWIGEGVVVGEADKSAVRVERHAETEGEYAAPAECECSDRCGERFARGPYCGRRAGPARRLDP